MRDVKTICMQRGLIYKGDEYDQLSKEERENGHIKFNIPEIGKIGTTINGEGVWGWVSPDDKIKYNDDSFYGELPTILCNDSIYFDGLLFDGMEVMIKCNGEKRPVISPSWVQANIFDKEWYKKMQNGYTDECESNKVNLRQVSHQICETFENLLHKHSILIPDEYRSGDPEEACIFGVTYDNLENEVKEILIKLANDIKRDDIELETDSY